MCHTLSDTNYYDLELRHSGCQPEFNVHVGNHRFNKEVQE